MNKPVAVLISDIHYSLQTLELADAAMRQAIKKSNDLLVPLIVAGDLHDTKANLRGECVNRMLETFDMAKDDIYIIIGNHDRLNEKAAAHSLNFLSCDYPTRFIVDEPMIYIGPSGTALLPYYHDPEELRAVLKTVPKDKTIIMHQGIEGSNSGEYIQDKSAIAYNDVKDFRVISGHYHCRQDIKTGRPRKGAAGLFSYIGNPYTMNFAEANDPEKGFQILMSDGTLEFVPTNLRKHIKIDISIDYVGPVPTARPEDLVWVKISGTRDQLNKVTKNSIRGFLGIPSDYRLELVPTDIRTELPKQKLTHNELLDAIIDSISTGDSAMRVKDLWKELCK